MQQQAVPDQAAVDEQEDRIAIGLLDLGPRNESGEAKHAAGRILRLSSKLGDGFGRRHVRRRQQQLALAAFQLDQLLQRLAAEYLVDALAQGRDRCDVQKLAASGYQLKSLAGMRQAVMRGQRGDVGQLGLVRAQEFLARRHVEKQVAHGDGRSRRESRLVAAQHFTPGDLDPRAGRFLGGAGFEQQPRHRGDGRKRLAAKPQRGDGEQVLDVAQLAGGMALEGQHGVVARHAAAIVGDADQAPAAVFHLDAKARGAGVQ